MVLNNRARGNGQKLMHRKFHLNFFTLQVTQHLKLIAERSYGGSLKGDIPVWTQHCAMCSGCLSRGRLEQVTHCCPFQPQPSILGFFDSVKGSSSTAKGWERPLDSDCSMFIISAVW